ncbi:MAG: hypothetical protein HYU86_00435 [Chloroflexi bacterium]|nr:hypothetical protein [Chloroflexota bacterium]
MSARRWFVLLLMLAVAVLFSPDIALANGEHVHIVGFQLTYLTAYILGGTVGGLFLLAVGGWALAYRSLKKQEARKRGGPNAERRRP